MSNQQTRGRLLAGTVLAGMAFMGFSAPAMAQTPAPAQPAAAEGEEIVVTGSRIARQDFVANSPIQTVTAEEIRSTGELNTEELLNTLPQVVPGLSASSNNPSNGTATVDLRGIGASRTLVLVNGKRIVPAERGNVVDLNTIPTRMIERVEVVTGGASAVYGSDALGGVVNFILKDDFEGVEIDGQYGISGESDAEQFNMSFLFGANTSDGKGNVTGHVSYYDRDRLLATDRAEWAVPSFAGGSATGRARFDQVALNPFCTVTRAAADALLTPAGPCAAYAGANTIGGNLAFNDNGTIRAFNNSFNLLGATDRYDFAPVNNLLSPAERFSASFTGHYDVAPWATLYGELFYSDSRNAAQLAPTPMVGAVVPATNPFLANAQNQAIIAARPNPTAPLTFRRRMVEVGARVETRNADMYQVNLGMKGDLPFAEGWDYDAYFGFGRTEFNTGIQNDVSRSRVSAALNATSTTSCGPTLLAIFPGCVPVNFFGGPGTITPTMANFIRLNFDDETLFERHNLGISFSGPTFQLPAGTIDVALGAEYREDELTYTPDAAKAAGDIFGFNAERPVAGMTDVKEVFVEALVPLIKDAPFAKYVGLELGARYSDYSTVGGLTTYKAGGEWEIIDGMRLRGMYQRANRAPNVFELFQAGDQGFPGVTDPCAVTTVTGTVRTLSAATRAFCQVQLGFDPVPANFTQTNAQIEAFFFGNPNLKEEVSDTFTLGGVWSPSFAEGLTFTLDYYNIKVEDYIGSLEGGTTGVVTACFASGSLTSSACNIPGIGALIFRDAAGELKARVPLANVSELETNGVDFTVDYGLPMGWTGLPSYFGDTLDLNLSLTYLNSWKLDDIEYKGTVGAYNISAALPEIKANLRIGYDVGPVRITYNGQYIDAMDNQGNIPDFADPSGYLGVEDAYWYHDLSASWSVNKVLELNAGVKNIGDKDPPVMDNAADGNTDPNTYDIIGRYFFVGARAKF